MEDRLLPLLLDACKYMEIVSLEFPLLKYIYCSEQEHWFDICSGVIK